MTGLSTSIVAHKLPTNPMCPPVKQKLKKFKPNMSLKIKEEVTKKIKAKVLSYKVMPFGLKNVGATYMRAMTTIFHDMIHKEIEVYVDYVIIKSKRVVDHIADLRKFFDRLRRYNIKLNPEKCAFGVPAGKHLGFIVRRRGIELDLSKVKAIQELPPPKSKKDAVKGQALADHLVENLVVGEYEPLKTYFPDEEVSFVGEDIVKAYDGWRMFFDGFANFKGVGIGAVLVPKTGFTGDWRFESSGTSGSRRMGYEEHQDITILVSHAGMMKRFPKIEFKHVPRIQNVFADALATLASMIQHPDKNFINPVPVRIHNQPAYCVHVEEETDGKPWFHDIKEYLAKGEYPKQANHTQKRTLRRLSNHFFQSGETLYRKTPDLGLLRYVDAKEVSRLLEEIHAGTCGPHMNGFVLAKKIFRAGYFWMTTKTDMYRNATNVRYMQT
ncbi:uncharacterized protein [Nicotiana sylvestris]|uniref:uncharacterized protein n=1 Tax=Nicotiana sylvestris TaxID=4096 RepID=UPI00388C48DB